MDIPQIDVEELARHHAAGAVIIDVRNDAEFEEVRVPGAVLIPLDQLPDRLDEVPEGDTLLIICRSGGRSQRACEFLATQGHDVANVAGGTLAWVESGRPVESGPG